MKDVKSRRFGIPAVDRSARRCQREGKRLQLLNQFVASPLKGFIVFAGCATTTSTLTPVIRVDTTASQPSFCLSLPNKCGRINPLEDTALFLRLFCSETHDDDID